MKKIVLLGLLSIFLTQNSVHCEQSCDLNTLSLISKTDIIAAYNCLKSQELEVIKLNKNQKFIVQSQQPMSSDTPVGSLIDFVTVQDVSIFPGEEASKITFTGEIIENKPPRLLGRSSTLKLAINKMKVDKITYPAEAYITKMGKKQIMAGILAAAPIYLGNLADTADKGTITIDKIYKDPCQYRCESIKSPIRPLYYLGGAVLQLADLFIAPVICVFKRGEEIDIPQYTSFEIKLEDDVSLLKL